MHAISSHPILCFTTLCLGQSLRKYLGDCKLNDRRMVQIPRLTQRANIAGSRVQPFIAFVAPVLREKRLCIDPQVVSKYKAKLSPSITGGKVTNGVKHPVVGTVCTAA
jgi:hypothetical protein